MAPTARADISVIDSPPGKRTADGCCCTVAQSFSLLSSLQGACRSSPRSRTRPDPGRWRRAAARPAGRSGLRGLPAAAQRRADDRPERHAGDPPAQLGDLLDRPVSSSSTPGVRPASTPAVLAERTAVADQQDGRHVSRLVGRDHCGVPPPAVGSGRGRGSAGRRSVQVRARRARSRRGPAAPQPAWSGPERSRAPSQAGASVSTGPHSVSIQDRAGTVHRAPGPARRTRRPAPRCEPAEQADRERCPAPEQSASVESSSSSPSTSAGLPVGHQERRHRPAARSRPARRGPDADRRGIRPRNRRSGSRSPSGGERVLGVDRHPVITTLVDDRRSVRSPLTAAGPASTGGPGAPSGLRPERE